MTPDDFMDGVRAAGPAVAGVLFGARIKRGRSRHVRFCRVSARA
jgi:hypothetical protein